MALTIQERLKDLRVERGLTLEQLAGETGLSKSALGSYESEDYKDISHHAINRLADFYGVTADYLLARTETKSHPNAEALLCELATHPDFTKLLADIQIYVEGIASMQIQNLNAWVDVARAEIMEKYQPKEQDKTMYLMQSAHVEEGDYFRSRVHKDMDSILEDIRNAHAGRSDGALKTSVAEELRQDLEEVAAFEGSRAEQLLMVFCKQPKLRYNKLTEDEKQSLIRIMQKSELMKSPISQRGRKK